MKTTLNSHLNPMSRARKIAPFNRIPWSEPQRRVRGQCPDPRSAPRGCRIPVARCQGFEHGWSEQLRWWKEHKSRLKSEKKYVTILMHFGNSNCIYIYILICVCMCVCIGYIKKMELYYLGLSPGLSRHVHPSWTFSAWGSRSFGGCASSGTGGVESGERGSGDWWIWIGLKTRVFVYHFFTNYTSHPYSIHWLAIFSPNEMVVWGMPMPCYWHSQRLSGVNLSPKKLAWSQAKIPTLTLNRGQWWRLMRAKMPLVLGKAGECDDTWRFCLWETMVVLRLLLSKYAAAVIKCCQMFQDNPKQGMYVAYCTCF